MLEQAGNITKLEWISCPDCSTTFQVAVPSITSDMRIRIKADYVDTRQYWLRVRCVNSTCKKMFFVETNLPKNFRTSR